MSQVTILLPESISEAEARLSLAIKLYETLGAKEEVYHFDIAVTR